jgi:hypothetical protein
MMDMNLELRGYVKWTLSAGIISDGQSELSMRPILLPIVETATMFR